MKKFDWKARLKSAWMWLSIVAAALIAIGVDFSQLTNWPLVIDGAKEILGNPYRLGLFVVALVGIINNPTTKGITDIKK